MDEEVSDNTELVHLLLDSKSSKMENESSPGEKLAFVNTGSKRIPSTTWKWKTKTPIFIACSFLALALSFVVVTVIWHMIISKSSNSEVSDLSYQLCGNQSTKACILDPQCSSSRMRRLVNGRVTSKGSWPWMAEIVYNGKHYCGAVLVSGDTLITAAHCLYHHGRRLYEGDIEIIIGGRSKLSTENSTQRPTLSHIHIHDAFELTSLQNDIAILRLERSLQFTRSVWPICLSSGSKGTVLDSNGIMIGWGKTSYKGQFSTMLRETSVPFVAASICTKANKGLFDGVEVNPVKHICVGYGKHSTENGCNGDSGGPLMVQSKNGRWLLVGIMSWGEPECSSQRTDSYTVFTSISPYLSWIKSVLNR